MVERSAVNRLVVGSNPTSGAAFPPCFGSMFCRIPRANFTSARQTICQHASPTTTARTKSPESSPAKTARGPLSGANSTRAGHQRWPGNVRSSAGSLPRPSDSNCSDFPSNSVVESRLAGINRLVVGSNPTSGAAFPPCFGSMFCRIPTGNSTSAKLGRIHAVEDAIKARLGSVCPGGMAVPAVLSGRNGRDAGGTPVPLGHVLTRSPNS